MEVDRGVKGEMGMRNGEMGDKSGERKRISNHFSFFYYLLFLHFLAESAFIRYEIFE